MLNPIRAAAAESQEVLAEALFAEGRTHMLAGRYDQACPLFAESLRLDRATGTALNLALCHERQGKLASAWASYKTALSLAKDENKSAREKVARERIDALEKRLSRLLVSVPESARLPGLALELDEIRLGEPTWGLPYPVDGGPHTLRASADGRVPWQREVSVADERDLQQVEIPVLEPVVAPEPVVPMPVASKPVPADGQVAASLAPPQPTPPNPPSQRHGLALAGAAASTAVTMAALGTGIYFGLEAKRRWADRTRSCPAQETHCDDVAVSAGHDAERAARLSTASFGVAIISGALTGYLIWHYGPSWFGSVQPAVQASPQSAGLSLRASF